MTTVQLSSRLAARGALEYDNETGEISEKPVFLNTETGEVETFCRRYRRTFRVTRHKPFKIPPSHINTPKEPPTFASGPVPRPDRQFILSGPALLFLLPTTIFFYPALSIILMISEIVLHMYAHKKNRQLKDSNSNVYYRSPLHMVVSEFCAICREDNAKLKITKIQDKRNDKYGFEYFKRIVT